MSTLRETIELAFQISGRMKVAIRYFFCFNSGFQPISDIIIAIKTSNDWLHSKDMKKTGPYYGATAIFQDYKDKELTQPTGSGHIAFLYGFMRGGNYILAGGNQGDRLKFSSYPITSGYIKAIGGYMHLEGFYFSADYRGPHIIAPLYRGAEQLNNYFGITSGGNSTR